jgi:flagellar biosynthesis protein FlhA
VADAASTSAAASTGLDLRKIQRLLARGDVALAAGISAILVMLILPMPSWLLDIALAISISFSALVLMTALFLSRPLEFSAFPTVLLIATMLRLGLNVASTRLILSNGQNGESAAGKIIEAFGSLVMQGNFVIGIIVFVILVIVNFVVITKGSGRIAEVAARFTLDAMPGKQMAIDADLSAGLINEAEARARRTDLEAEANFYGAMDGASKFVRGDAMAGILITAINIIGGMVIGVAQFQMPFEDAANTYTVLTIGDGLVSQIPSLIISVAAGMLVSKAGVDEAADKALASQLASNPQGLAMVSGVCAIAAVMPGLPLVPFALIAVLTGAIAWRLHGKREAEAAEKVALEAQESESAAPAEDPIENSLAIDALKIELGYSLLPLINDVEGRRLTDQIKALRRQLAGDMGVILPPVRILDNLQLEPNDYVIRIKELDAGRGALRMRHLLVMDPSGGQVDLPGEHVKEPAFGLPATWIDEGLREEATFRGCTVVDPATVLATHLTELLRENLPELLTFAETEKLLGELSKEHHKLLDDISPSQITRSGIQRVLQSLLRERVSIRDLATILEAIAESSATTQDLIAIVEHVRARLARQICHANAAPDGALAIVTLSPQWEQTFAEALIGEGENRQLALAPSKLHEFVQAVRKAFDAAAAGGDAPVLLTSPVVRPYIRSLAERFRNQTVVMSQNEIHPRAKLRTVGQV